MLRWSLTERTLFGQIFEYGEVVHRASLQNAFQHWLPGECAQLIQHHLHHHFAGQVGDGLGSQGTTNPINPLALVDRLVLIKPG